MNGDDEERGGANEPRRLLDALRELKRRQAAASPERFRDVFRFFGSWKKSILYVYLPVVLAVLYIVFLWPTTYHKVTPGEVKGHHQGGVAPTARPLERIEAEIPPGVGRPISSMGIVAGRRSTPRASTSTTARWA